MARMLPGIQRLEDKARDANYHPGRLAELLDVSEWQLRRAIHDIFHTPPRQWLNGLRLKVAESSLSEDGLAKNACLIAGFKETHNFCRWFKQQKGLTAREYVASLPSRPSSHAQSEASQSHSW